MATGKGGVNFQEISRNPRDQLCDRTREHEESLRVVERVNNQINEKERELEGIHERQVAAIDQARLVEASRFVSNTIV